MMSKPRSLALPAVTALVLATFSPTASAGDGTPQLDLMPADTNIIINVNLKRLRGGKALAEILEMAGRNEDFKKTAEGLKEAGLKLERDIDTISIGMRATGDGDPDGIVVVAEGRFKLKNVIAAMKAKKPEKAESELKKKSHRGVTYYEVGDDGAIATLGKHLVMAEVGRIKDVIDLHKRVGKSVAKNTKLKAMRTRTDTRKDIWFVVDMPQRKKAGAGFGGPPMAEKIRTMTGSLDLKIGLDVRLRVGFTDAETPKELVSQFEMVKPMAAEQLKEIGLDGVLDKSVLVADEKDIMFSVDLTAAEAEKLKSIAQQAGGAI